MARGRRSFNYMDLHDEEFEELTFLVVHLEEPDLIKTANPDLGLDGVVLGQDGGPSPRGFQAKHFTRGPSWPQCRKSLDDAVANYAVKHVTFTFPSDLTGKQIKKFNEELSARHPDVKVDWWGASELTARLIGSDDGERVARYIFGDEQFERMARLIRAQQELDTGGQAMLALSATANLFGGDPFFNYSFGSRPRSVPAVAPAEGAVMRVELEDEDGVRHIDAHARPAALAADRLPKGLLRLAGEDAIKRFQEFLRVGGELEVNDVALDFEQLPKYLAELVDDVSGGTVRLQAARALVARPMRFEIATATGGSSIDIDMQPTAPPAGWEHALEGTRGGLTMQMWLRRSGDRGQLNLTWTWRLSTSSPAAEQLLALRLLEAAAKPSELRVIDPSTGEVTSVGPSPQPPFDEGMKNLLGVMEDVVALEYWIGQTIEMPEKITGADANAVHRVVRSLNGIDGTWTTMNLTLNNDPGADALPDGGVLQFRRTLWLDLFGKRYDVGDEVTYVSEVKVASSESVEGGRTYVLKPASPNASTHTKLERPKKSGSPEEGAADSPGKPE